METDLSLEVAAIKVSSFEFSSSARMSHILDGDQLKP